MQLVDRLLIDSESEAWEVPVVGAKDYASTVVTAKQFVAMRSRPGGPLADANDHDRACWTVACVATSLLAPQARERGVDIDALLTRFVDRAPQICDALAKAVYFPALEERQFADGKGRLWTVPQMWMEKAEAAMQQAIFLTRFYGSDLPPSVIAVCHLLLDDINSRGVQQSDFVESMSNPASIKAAGRAMLIACGVLPSEVDSLAVTLEARPAAAAESAPLAEPEADDSNA